MTFALHGIGTSKGIAIGKVRSIGRDQPDVTEYQIDKKGIRSEISRYNRAIKLAKRELAAVKRRIPKDTALDVSAFIDTHLLMLEDSALTAVPIDGDQGKTLQRGVGTQDAERRGSCCFRRHGR